MRALLGNARQFSKVVVLKFKITAGIRGEGAGGDKSRESPRTHGGRRLHTRPQGSSPPGAFSSGSIRNFLEPRIESLVQSGVVFVKACLFLRDLDEDLDLGLSVGCMNSWRSTTSRERSRCHFFWKDLEGYGPNLEAFTHFQQITESSRSFEILQKELRGGTLRARVFTVWNLESVR